jgi:hypothetical protein
MHAVTSAALSIATFAVVLGLVGGCAVHAPSGPCSFDVLHEVPAPAPHALAGKPISDADYERFVAWGADWFRGETLGGERAVTDVLGLLDGVVTAPCPNGPPGCVEEQRVFDLFVTALDALDGVTGNLFTGNGGRDGLGYTSDLVIRFPAGARLFGAIPVPETLHTGLDVEAGEPWPIGMVAVDAPPQDRGLAYLHVPSRLGAGPGSSTPMRLGVTCALCHYSLDVDGDGKADLKSARLGRVTPGSPYRPQDAWAIGNQDLHFGWLLSLSSNPLVAFTLLSGPIGSDRPDDAVAFVRWVRDFYVRAPEAVLRQVAIGMLLQPRGSPDDTPDALHQGMQMPSLLPWGNWPYNATGAFEANNLNNVVWTGSIDLTGLIGLAGDRASARAGVLYWEPPSIYALLPAERYADIMTRYSPAVRSNGAAQRALMDDILGASDGVPGLLDPNAEVVMEGPSGALPHAIFEHPANRDRRRNPQDYGARGVQGAGMLALLGTRIRTPPALRAAVGMNDLVGKYGIDPDEFFTNVVSLMLDSQIPPPNLSPLLVGQWPLVQRGYRIFQREGCAVCHAGPFLTDNRVKRLSALAADDVGLSPPSTAGWTFRGRDAGPGIGTDPARAIGTRPEELFLASAIDPTTGEAVSPGGIVRGLVSDRRIGYKTPTLRNLWATPPYLHDGSVGVAFPPGAHPPDDLRARLRAAHDDSRLIYGMGLILDSFEERQSDWHRPDAALSLQALLLERERRRIVASSRLPSIHVAAGAVWSPTGGAPPERVTMASLGVSGKGHEFWIDDEPGGDRITALVAFLLALDDRPCEIPGDPSHCL